MERTAKRDWSTSAAGLPRGRMQPKGQPSTSKALSSRPSRMRLSRCQTVPTLPHLQSQPLDVPLFWTHAPFTLDEWRYFLFSTFWTTLAVKTAGCEEGARTKGGGGGGMSK